MYLATSRPASVITQARYSERKLLMTKILILFSAVLFFLLATLPAMADGSPMPIPKPKGGKIAQVVVV